MGADARPGAETVCWSAVHGFALLHLDGPMRAVPEREREAELDRMLVAARARARRAGLT